MAALSVVRNNDDSFQQARNRADQIKHHFAESVRLLKEAFEQEDWRVLGYSSWNEYFQQEFGKSLVKLTDVAKRKELVKELAEARDADGDGLGAKDIAKAVGVGVGTVDRELFQMENLDRPEYVKGGDGKRYPTSKKTVDKPAAEYYGEDDSTIESEVASDPKYDKEVYKPITKEEIDSHPMADYRRVDAEVTRMIDEMVEKYKKLNKYLEYHKDLEGIEIQKNKVLAYHQEIERRRIR